MPNESETDLKRRLQAEADPAYQVIGSSPPPALFGEPSVDYQRRLLRPLQRHSDTWAGVGDLRSATADVLAVVAKDVYAATIASTRSSKNVPEGTLREVKSRDASGRDVREFYGHPSAWTNDFKIAKQIRRVNVSGLRGY